jgi:hypothetical protein
MPHKDPAVRRAKIAEYMRRRYHTDPQYREAQCLAVRLNNAKAREKTQSLISQAKAGGCIVCSEKEPCCLGFHHLDPSTKEFDIGNAYQRRISPNRLARELAKCVCLCHNCHAKLHAGLINLP